MGRYGYSACFAVMGGGVSAGMAGVVIGGLTSEDPSWAPLASGVIGLVFSALIFGVVLRATRPIKNPAEDP